MFVLTLIYIADFIVYNLTRDWNVNLFNANVIFKIDTGL